MRAREQMLLEEYSRELGIAVSIQQLIQSHQRIRARLRELEFEKKSSREAECKKVVSEYHDATWVLWSDLNKMTLQEINERIGY